MGYYTNKESQRRQRSFEIMMSTIQSLETAKREIVKVTSELRGALNAAILAEDEDPDRDHLQLILRSYSLSFNLFKVIEHHLAPKDRNELRDQIEAFDQAVVDGIESGKPINSALDIKDIALFPGKLERIVDTTIQSAQESLP